MTEPRSYMKAIIGGLIAGLGALGAGAAESGVTLAEWCVVAGAALTAFQGVYWVSNKPA